MGRNRNGTVDVTDDRTPVDTTCGAAIRDRSGAGLDYVCNLGLGHLGRHAQTFDRASVTEIGDGVPCDGTFGMTVKPNAK